MINTIIFDIGNVLAHFNWKEVYDELFDEEVSKIVAEATVLDAELWNQLDKGAMSHEQIMEAFYRNAPDYKEQIDLAISETYKRIRPFPYAVPLLKSLKENGYRIYLLSNYGRVPFETSRRNFDFLNYVDGEVISYQVQQIKPQAQIYRTLCRKYQITPDEAVFLDDNAANVAAADALGFQTILFDDADGALRRLKEMGVNFQI